MTDLQAAIAYVDQAHQALLAALNEISKDDRRLTSTRRQLDTNAAALDCHRLMLEIVARERGETPAP